MNEHESHAHYDNDAAKPAADCEFRSHSRLLEALLFEALLNRLGVRQASIEALRIAKAMAASARYKRV